MCFLLHETEGLGPGAAAAITLAWENRNLSKLILDEKRGRRIAHALGLQKTGLVGIIGEAAEHGWLEIDVTIERIVQTGFHVRQPLIDAVRKRLQFGGLLIFPHRLLTVPIRGEKSGKTRFLFKRNHKLLKMSVLNGFFAHLSARMEKSNTPLMGDSWTSSRSAQTPSSGLPCRCRSQRLPRGFEKS